MNRIFFCFLLVSFPAFGQHAKTKQQQPAWVNTSLFSQKVFVENSGQFENTTLLNKADSGETIKYYCNSGGVAAYFTNMGITYCYSEIIKPERKVHKPEMEIEKTDDKSALEEEEELNRKTIKHSLKMKWLNANLTPEIVAEEKASAYFTYGDRQDKTGKTCIKASAYEKVVYKNLYPHIDVEYTFPEGKDGLKYAIILHPGADHSLVKMMYDEENVMAIDEEGNAHIKSTFGEFIDHAPVTKYQNGAMVKSDFVLSGNILSFKLDNYDETQTLIIDPWTTNPLIPTDNMAYDVEYDFQGNVYVYGGRADGGANAYQEMKFNSSGVWQWTYVTTVFGGIGYLYGDFAVDAKSGSSYIIEPLEDTNPGVTPQTVKLNAGGIQIALFPGISGFHEQWRIEHNPCTGKLLVGGGSLYGSLYAQIGIMDTNLTSLTAVDVLNYQNNLQDVQVFTMDDFGNYYAITSANTLAALSPPQPPDNYLFKGPATATLVPLSYWVPTAHKFIEMSTSFNPNMQTCAHNGISVSNNFVYTYDGYLLEKRNSATGALVSSVQVNPYPIPYPAYFFIHWAGVAVDACNNVYVGSKTSIKLYDSNLALLSTTSVPDTVYDVQFGNGTVYATGRSFVSALSITPPSGPCGNLSSVVTYNCTAGQAAATLYGAVSPATYLWNPSGQTTQTATGLSSGTYTVSVTSGGCYPFSSSLIINISAISIITASVSATQSTCGNNNGSATATAIGGASPYTYSWNPSSQTTSAITGLSGGNYTCTVTDATGCTAVQTISVPSSTAVIAGVSATPSACGNNNGSATVTASGGTSPYTYSWNPSSQTTSTATGLGVGNYTATITDTNGCTNTQTVSVTATGGPAVTTSSTPQTCAQGGTAAANASGGSTPYTYQWCNGQTTSVATGLSAGSCTVIVTDAGGCSVTSTVTITANVNIPSATVTATSASCGNSNGTSTVTASGGSAPYTYGWSTSPVQTTATATGLAGGNYTVTVTDAIGCSAIQTVSVTSGSGLNAAITSTQTGCTVNNGTAAASVSGGTSPYTYLWNPSGQTASTATGLGAGNYSVTMTDASGCTQTQTVSVTQTPGPTAAVTASAINISLGGSSQLTATGGGTYSWSPATGLSCTTCPNPTATAVAPSGAGGLTYCVFVTDVNGCKDSVCITINVEIPCGDIFVPNAFSPNNDGKNEMECVLGNCIETLKFSIFDRWGEKVFETTDPKICWDGIYKGKLMNTATFVYYLEAVLANGEQINKKGNISLIR
ncbi:MAG: T9SS type B sorting domain-containing protein [Bacteroidetes bacterium]|nr:MAG: T9SS type B sorting domain-containing protein [Bacteroidota bacterium]